VVQHAREPRVPSLSHAAGVSRSLFLRRIEMDVEMFGLERPELEALVLNPVPAEILSLQRRRQEHENEGEELKRESIAATG
jgi:hypothetical protein